MEKTADKIYRNVKIFPLRWMERRRMQRRLPFRTASSFTLAMKQVSRSRSAPERGLSHSDKPRRGRCPEQRPPELSIAGPQRAVFPQTGCPCRKWFRPSPCQQKYRLCTWRPAPCHNDHPGFFCFRFVDQHKIALRTLWTSRLRQRTQHFYFPWEFV